MSQDKGAQEPSMEEILSSIRRIIAEDDKGQGEPAAAAAGATGDRPGGEGEDVLELTEIATDETAAAAASAAAADAATDDSSMKETDTVDRSASAEGLISGAAATASTSALARLSRAATPEERKSSTTAGQSMDEFITELLRPSLKDWLDQHLPEIVERIVEQEVKKLARRAELS
jgi:cell pole-organizing protein PopZ